MNAKEKLAFEKLAGKYTPASWSATSEFELQKLYNQKLAEIESGIDTYWLTEPLRVGVNQKHSLYIEGGEGSFLFGIGAGITVSAESWRNPTGKLSAEIST